MIKISIIIALLLITFGGFAQRENFSKEKFVRDDNELLYRFMIPENYNQDSTEKYPVVLFLHGAGERGNDNEKQLTYIDEIFGANKMRKEHPCFVIVPQCPENKKWVEVDWSLMSNKQPAQMSESLKLTISLLYTIIRKYNIDSNRIYVVGLSMGGYGTWDVISRFPYLFAAAIPICGGGDEAQASKLADVPIWAFHGTKDKVVPVERSRNMVEAISKAGGKPKYTEFPNRGHLVWNSAFATTGIWDWLFSQSKIK